MRILLDFFRPFLFPIFALFRGISDKKRGILARFFLTLLNFAISLPFWSLVYALTFFSARGAYVHFGDELGFIPQPVIIAGTGSMYPTFPKGKGATEQEREAEDVAAPLMYRYPRGFEYQGKRYFDYTLKRGDIVSFSNQKTKELITADGADPNRTTGFVKRVIGLPGDVVEIRDGFVYMNGEFLQEPYTASARSTFGGEFVPDCQKVAVPEEHLLVMGDNRKGSSDSRNRLGFIQTSDVTRFLPLEEQAQYESGWRNPSKDLSQAKTVVLDARKYLKLLNEIRVEHGVKPLTYDERLENSARARANVMLKYNDLSFEATRSGYTMQKAMSEAGYGNIVWGEAPTLGYYSAEELVENYQESPAWEKFLLDETYEDTGIAAVIGSLNGCPVQIVVQHVGGYQPPNYSANDLESWKTLRQNLQDILPSWENARTFGATYEENKDKYERVIFIIRERISTAESVISRMEANQWLTDQENDAIKRDRTLADEQAALAEELNTH